MIGVRTEGNCGYDHDRGENVTTATHITGRYRSSSFAIVCSCMFDVPS
jgi:hypothetical protein